ncbi:hypothetical protein VTN00DRAFT_740 [Thermoascus crustaceus]|uniref:uncharacterized protein n=1 Tax=Thermoascus crustaceus TaxID=5088 RepID=UPI003743F584
MIFSPFLPLLSLLRIDHWCHHTAHATAARYCSQCCLALDLALDLQTQRLEAADRKYAPYCAFWVSDSWIYERTCKRSTRYAESEEKKK